VLKQGTSPPLPSPLLVIRLLGGERLLYYILLLEAAASEEEKKKKEELSGSIWRQRGPVRLDERSEPARLPCGGGDAKHR